VSVIIDEYVVVIIIFKQTYMLSDSMLATI
jgi:hypothetical protein